MVAPAITRLPGETNEEWKKRYQKAYQEANKERLAELRQDPEKKRRAVERTAKWRENLENRKRHAKQTAKWLENPANKRRQAEHAAKWQKNNRDVCAAHNAAHRAQKRQACPPWACQGEIKTDIEAKYAERERLERKTGIPHHVDHIVPLQGRNVCGLHVPWNLRVIPANDNRSKGNRLTPEVLELCHSIPQETLSISA